MGFRRFMLRAAMLGIVIVATSIVAFASYLYGKQSALEEATGQTQRAIAAAFVDAHYGQAMEARHDRGMVELLRQRRVEDAYLISQERYFSRVLLLPDIAGNSNNSATQQRIVEEVMEAKAMLESTGFQYKGERALKAWATTLQYVSDLKRSSPNSATK